MATVITAGNATNGLSLSADNFGALEFKTGSGAGTTALTLSSAQVVSIPGNLSFNSGYGSAAVAYGCRAWVNFNGTGTVAINSSGNVTSITDNGTGDYTVNFTTAMTDANYGVATTPMVVNDQGSSFQFGIRTTTNTSTAPTTKTTTAVRLLSRRETDYDLQNCNVAIFR
jgi:hypothetical protein